MSRREALIALGNAVRALTSTTTSGAEESSCTNEGALEQRSVGSSLALGVFSFPAHLPALRDHSL